MEVGWSSNFFDLDFSVLDELLEVIVEVALYPPGDVKAAAEIVPAETVVVVVALVPATLTVWREVTVTVEAEAV